MKKQQRKKLEDLAASIPGLHVGVGEGNASTAPTAQMDNTYVGDCPVEDVKTKPWLPILLKLQQMGEVDPGSAAEEFNTLLKGEQFRQPKGWHQWSMEKRARWLDQNKALVEEDW